MTPNANHSDDVTLPSPTRIVPDDVLENEDNVFDRNIHGTDFEMRNEIETNDRKSIKDFECTLQGTRFINPRRVTHDSEENYTDRFHKHCNQDNVCFMPAPCTQSIAHQRCLLDNFISYIEIRGRVEILSKSCAKPLRQVEIMSRYLVLCKESSRLNSRRFVVCESVRTFPCFKHQTITFSCFKHQTITFSCFKHQTITFSFYVVKWQTFKRKYFVISDLFPELPITDLYVEEFLLYSLLVSLLNGKQTTHKRVQLFKPWTDSLTKSTHDPGSSQHFRNATVNPHLTSPPALFNSQQSHDVFRDREQTTPRQDNLLHASYYQRTWVIVIIVGVPTEPAHGQICLLEKTTEPTHGHVYLLDKTTEPTHGQICLLEKTTEPTHGQICLLDKTTEPTHGQICLLDKRTEPTHGQICLLDKRTSTHAVKQVRTAHLWKHLLRAVTRCNDNGLHKHCCAEFACPSTSSNPVKDIDGAMNSQHSDSEVNIYLETKVEVCDNSNNTDNADDNSDEPPKMDIKVKECDENESNNVASDCNKDIDSVCYNDDDKVHSNPMTLENETRGDEPDTFTSSWVNTSKISVHSMQREVNKVSQMLSGGESTRNEALAPQKWKTAQNEGKHTHYDGKNVVSSTIDSKDSSKKDNQFGNHDDNILNNFHDTHFIPILSSSNEITVCMLKAPQQTVVHSGFEQELHRLATFVNFPAPEGVYVIPLASNGFFYPAGSNDVIVECAFCAVTVNASQFVGRKAAEVHKRASPNCPFVLGLTTGNVSMDMSRQTVGNTFIGNPGISAKSEVSEKRHDGIISSPNFGAAALATDGALPNRPTAAPTLPSDKTQDGHSMTLSPSQSVVSAPDGIASLTVADSKTVLQPYTSMPFASFTPDTRPIPNATVAFQTETYQTAIASSNPNRGDTPFTPATNSDTGSKTEGQERQVVTYEQLGIFAQRPKRPDMAISATRANTFSGWPHSTTHPPQDMADAGFYYTGTADLVRCFHCKGGLKTWDASDNPWVEHGRWFPTCPYVRLCKGHKFVDAIKALNTHTKVKISFDDVQLKMKEFENTVNKNKISLARANSSQMPEMPECNGENQGASFGANLKNGVYTEDNEKLREVSRRLEQENQEMISQTLCKICQSEAVSVLLLPCGHLVACAHCAPALRKCAVCRQAVKGAVRVELD